MAEEKGQISKKELIERIRQRWPLMRDCERERREKAAKMMRFLYVKGAQWEDVPGAGERGDRPKYEFNELKIKAHRIGNEMRANPPAWKVRAVEDGDTETAEVNEGLLRNLWSVSNGNHITDYASRWQVGGGLGAWRVDTDYASDSSFYEDILFKPILNPLCLYWDPAAKDQLKQTAEDWFYTEKISEFEFKRRWPNQEPVEFEGGLHDERDDWRSEGQVRIGEYWWKQMGKKTIVLLDSGKVVDKAEYQPTDGKIVDQRDVQCPEIWMCIMGGGDTILEGPAKWKGKYFPFVVVFGEYVVIDGNVVWYGITEDGVDAQQGFNSTMTSIVETINASPQSKYWATPEQAKGHLDQWAVAHKENHPVMLYNSDTKAPGPPQRMGSPDVPVALINLAGMMRDNMKGVTGVFDASIGQQSNETSGRAITARQNQGEIANFHFPDNMALAIQWSGKIAQDLVPKVYPEERSIRILGSDLAEKYVKINQVQPDPKKPGKLRKVHDLSAGRYDLTVTVGPSWATRRQEAADVYTEMARGNPAIWNVAGDLLFKAMDLPYAPEIAERMKAILPPQVQQTLQQGKEIPPEVKQMMMQAEAAMQQVEQQAQLVQQAAAEAEQGKTEAEKAQLGVKQALADLEVKRAQFDAQVEKQLAAIATKQAALTVAAAQLDAKVSQVEQQQQKDEFDVESSQAATNIQAMAQEFSQNAAEIMQAMQAKEAELNSRIDQEISMLMQSPPPTESVQPEMVQ